MGTLDETLRAMVPNLYGASILYVPMDIVDLIEDQDIKRTWLQYADRLFIVEADGKNYFFEGEKDVTHHVWGKRFLLQNNLFTLMEKEEEIPTKRFRYLLDRYHENLMLCMMVSKYFLENYLSDLKNAQTNLGEAFFLQLTTFEDHKADLEDQFQFSGAADGLQTKVNFEDFSENAIVEKLKWIDTESLIDIPPKKPPIEDLPGRIERIEKEIGAEVDEFILGTVFYLDINNIK